MSTFDIIFDVSAALLVGVALVTVGLMAIDHHIQNPIVGTLWEIVLFVVVGAVLLKALEEVYEN